MTIFTVFLVLNLYMVTEAQQPFCLRRTPTGGCVCDKDTPCPDTKTKSLKCDLEKEVCVTSFDETNTFHPCTDGLCPLDNQFCYHGWCVFVPFIVTTSKPTFVFTKPTFVFTTPKPVTRPRKPTWFPRPMRPCVDWVKPGHSHSDCPARRHLCDNSLYYDVMTQECPRTCNRCYDNYGLPCPYRPPYYPYPGNREPFYPGNRQPFYPGRPGGWERRPADRWIPSIYNPCNGLPGGR